VGFFTIILAVWLWRADSRKWIRVLGLVALGAVIVQGVLGGLRVTMLKDELGIFHACLAQAFLCLLVFIGIARSRVWHAAPAHRTSGPLWLAIATTFLIFAQLALGATMRHQHRDLAILDFPAAYGQVIPDVSPENLETINRWRTAHALSEVDAGHIWLQMAHRIGAVIISIGVIWYAIALRRIRRPFRTLLTLSSVWVFFLAIQVTLGAWTIWTNKAADVATAHVAAGATMLALGVSIWALAARVQASRPASAMVPRTAPIAEGVHAV
jgi:cytochrome c oxidase assembly protein subunit 15